MSVVRYAIYFAPVAHDQLWRFGSGVIGYDAATGEEVAALVPEGVEPAVWHSWTEEPRRYGFHATIKAPFRLADGCTEDGLREALGDFAKRQQAFAIALDVASVKPFVALVAKEKSARLHALETAALIAFEPFRSPLTPAEYARRRPERLTLRQRTLLDQYGYPFVQDEFRFHLTLSGTMPEAECDRVAAKLGGVFREHLASTRIDALCLFRQNGEKARFRLLARNTFPM